MADNTMDAKVAASSRRNKLACQQVALSDK